MKNRETLPCTIQNLTEYSVTQLNTKKITILLNHGVTNNNLMLSFSFKH